MAALLEFRRWSYVRVGCERDIEARCVSGRRRIGAVWLRYLQARAPERSGDRR